MLVFSISAYVLTTYSYNLNKQRETETALREHNIILSMVEARISSIEEIYPDTATNKERLTAILRPLADYYKQQGGLFALFADDGEVFSDIPELDKRLLETKNLYDKNTQNKKIGDKRHVFVASKVPAYPRLTFVYARDISQIDDFQKDVGRIFIYINILVLVLIGSSVYLMLRHMTRPITVLNDASAEIASGAYDKRVDISSGDEFEQLGSSFNLMADSVEANIASLARSAGEKQDFIDDLSHEIKTPMTSILGYAEYLQNARISDEERMLATENLYQAVLQINDLSAKLMELTSLRYEAIEYKAVDLQSLFKDLANLTRPALSERGLSLNMQSDIESVNGDRTLLLSLFTNLVDNAARASKPKDVITVKAYQKHCPVIEVSDTGFGMDKQEISKVTEPFYRVEKSRSRKDGGIGLGLSIVVQIVSLHGAELEIISGPGEGTTVRIYFTSP